MPSFSSGYKAEYVALINEVESKMKEIIVEDITNGVLVLDTSKKIDELIKEFSDKIPNDLYEKKAMLEALKYSKRVLYNKFKSSTDRLFYKAQQEMKRVLGVEPQTQAELLTVMFGNLSLLNIKDIPDVTEGSTLTFEKGTPYIQDYYQSLRKSMDAIVDDPITEPPFEIKIDFTLPENQQKLELIKKGSLSLRSLMEMSIRQEFHINQKEQYEKDGTKLVWISTHADCSKRCENFQGKLYSLDKTSGTIDGYKYEPIEKATDIFITTKSGRVWKNGLFGFNCRHRMVKYEKNVRPPMDYSSKEIAKEREITEKQRSFERMIYKTELKAIILSKTEPKRSQKLKNKVSELKQVYQQYSKQNNHAFYPIRYQVSKKMRKYIRG